MTHLLIDDNRTKSMTKGEMITLPATIMDCPPMVVCGLAFYRHSQKISQILSDKLDKHVGKKMQLPKKTRSIDQVPEFDDVRLLVHSQPALTSTGTKKPKLLEIALGGSKADKITYAKEHLGKEITVAEVFEGEVAVDVHGITKGKGFQGTVKRFGVPIRQHKAEKTKRGIATLGSWTPKRVEFTVPQSGKMGYHLRTEYNKQILKIGAQGQDVNPAGGLTKYGLVKGSYLLVKGSVVGSRKRALVLTKPIRPNLNYQKDMLSVVKIAK